MDHDPRVAQRLAVVLAWWWLLRGRLAGQSPLLRQVAERAVPGSGGWCAAQFWLGAAALASADLAEARGYFTAVCDAIEGRGLAWALAGCLGGRSIVLANLGRIGEAVDDGHRALALAREAGYPSGEALPSRASASPLFAPGISMRPCGRRGRRTRSRPTSQAL